ncbi:MAG: 1,4-dihydroxy-2-naphthoate polyprenyltransferase [Acidobacteriota bacterium]
MASDARALPAPDSVGAWLLATRLPTLAAAAVPVAIGTAVAYRSGGAAWGPALAALVGALLIQIGTNFANDAADHDRGADTETRLGPTRAVQAGLLSAAQMRRGVVVAFALATLVGVYLTAVAGWPVIAIGVASLIAGWAYTNGPLPLAYNGLGDVFVIVFFGFVAVCGTVFVQLGAVPALAAWLSLPVGLLATGILVVNNLRDRHTDAAANKRTLAVRFGRGFCLFEYALILLIAHGVPLTLWLRGEGGPWMLLPLATIPFSLRIFVALVRRDGRALNPVLGATARLLIVWGALATIGLVLAA